MISVGFHTTKLQHDNIQYEKEKSSVCPKEITVTVVIQTFFCVCVGGGGGVRVSVS